MRPKHPPRPLLEKGFGPCVLEQVFPVEAFNIFSLRRLRNQSPLHHLKLVAAGNDHAVRLGISRNDVYILGQPNIVHTDLVFRIGFLLSTLRLFLFGEDLTRGFDNIQLLAVSFGHGRSIC